jgi:hypothetical protein
MLNTTDVVPACVAEDDYMPSIWIIVAAAVGAINVRLMAPIVLAFFGIGKSSVAHERSRHLPT